MLVELDILNFAIIKNLKIKFQKNMTVLIGETGAGKSILIDALSLLLGHRAQSEMIRTGEKKAVVTGLFTLSNSQRFLVENLCDDYGLPLDGDDLIISRELSNKGRNIIRINGQLTTITVLKQIGQYLVDIHGQSDQQFLMNQDNQIDLVDDYASDELKIKLKQYQDLYSKWQKLSEKLAHLQKDAQEIAQRQDILKFQKQELDSANLTDPDEDEKLENEFSKLNNYQKIGETANYLMQLFDDDEHGLTSLLGNAQTAADELADYGSDFKNMAQSLADGVYSLNDSRSELGDIMDNLDFDEERFQYVTTRLDTLNNLKKKYGPELSDVFKFYEKVDRELSQFEVGGLDESKIKAEINNLETKMQSIAGQIHEVRVATGLKLEKDIKQELADLFMEKARFSIRITPAKTFTNKGLDEVAFYIAPNPGEDLMPLVKIVSGGEQSRLILALKTIFSKVEPVGTMVFDEIDTGVSGRVSAAIGKKMHSIGQEKQVIAITHSVQVAASSDYRYKIEKHVENGTTFTEVHSLSEKESVTAIAQMMAGMNVTAAAEQNARDLIKRSQENKK
ncbi:DNA repair protein RecN [Lactobacillus psittaci]|uniref:DNA repair protein RecN n=1 Tax=Lactobacillus psittaci DSM 15354 TaxID=1122152 RepID=A0A0R1SBN4_9LACO|nr:DNA repair protein RecN [Lactobacillus psittaci]KRL63970.1 DNA repair protein RecN [Lactobacillus psittaci DSM 15354]